MDTTTVLVVIGCGVLVKTLAFIGFVVRRDRRQRRSLAAARAETSTVVRTVGPAAGPAVWQLLWSEPGVLLLENTGTEGPAHDVALSATLHTAWGTSATSSRLERHVGAGGFFEARFPELEAPLLEAATAMLHGERGPSDLKCTLTWSIGWTGDDGRERSASKTQAVLPVPELALDGV